MGNLFNFLVILAIFSVSTIWAQKQESVSNYYVINEAGQITLIADNVRPEKFTSDQIAYARYANRVNQTGWAELEIVTNAKFNDPTQAYYAGLLEGHLTSSLINSFRISSDIGAHLDLQNPLCRNASNWGADQTLKSIRDRIEANPNDTYWRETALTLYQIAGLDDGMNLNVNGSPSLRPHLNLQMCGNLLVNLLADLDDYEDISRHQTAASGGATQDSFQDKDTHCSALIKWIPDDGEILTAHNTWGSYSHMLRIIKRYTLNFETSKAKSISMSSYPGMVFSLDDFYISSTGLVIQETSISNYNNFAWGSVNPKEFVFEFLRNTVANRLATSGEEWSRIFSQHNSGTYNNQFMIVNYGKMECNGSLNPGTLTVLEQMPGLVHWEDMTDHLIKYGYWASYNVPYFADIYAHGGYPRILDARGDLYSHENTARARIFARDQHLVTNVSSLYHLMRYNDYQHDQYSHCNCTPAYSADLSISARSDLNDPKGQYPLHSLSFRLYGARDVKVTSSNLAPYLQFVATNGPSDEQQPPFDWRHHPNTDKMHLDQPALYNFQPILTDWEYVKEDGFPKFIYDS